MSNELTIQEKNILLDSIRDVHDFPKPGIIFKDITPLLGTPEALNILMDHLTNRYLGLELDFIAGIDARGFIFGSILADRLGIGFVPVRKKGKLPYTTVAQKYSLEYGFDEVEIHIDAFGKDGAKVVLIDDLIATGGTAKAACELIEKVGAKCVECCFVVELEFLNGKEKFEGQEIYSVIKF